MRESLRWFACSIVSCLVCVSALVFSASAHATTYDWSTNWGGHFFTRSLSPLDLADAVKAQFPARVGASYGYTVRFVAIDGFGSTGGTPGVVGSHYIQVLLTTDVRDVSDNLVNSTFSGQDYWTFTLASTVNDNDASAGSEFAVFAVVLVVCVMFGVGVVAGQQR